jgi:hypothetical protein
MAQCPSRVRYAQQGGHRQNWIDGLRKNPVGPRRGAVRESDARTQTRRQIEYATIRAVVLLSGDVRMTIPGTAGLVEARKARLDCAVGHLWNVANSARVGGPTRLFAASMIRIGEEVGEIVPYGAIGGSSISRSDVAARCAKWAAWIALTASSKSLARGRGFGCGTLSWAMGRHRSTSK